MIDIQLAPETLKMLTEQKKSISDAIMKGFRDGMYSLEAKVKNSFGKTGFLNVRTGHLRRSIKVTIKREGSEIVGAIGSNVKYAAIHEYGGVIKAKNAPYLHFKTSKGNWVRVKQVTIPKRPFIAPFLKSGARTIERNINEEIAKATGGNK